MRQNDDREAPRVLETEGFVSDDFDDDNDYEPNTHSVDGLVVAPLNIEDAEDCQGYQSVSSNANANSGSGGGYRWERISRRTLLSDDRFAVGGVRILDGPVAVKLLKFLLFTAVGIEVMYFVIRLLNWENDSALTLYDIWVYESKLIVLDAVCFFLVGRLHRQRGVDHLAWLGWALLANFYSSFITSFSFLEHSFTLYEMHCRWPLTLWMFVVVVLVLVVGLILMHIKYAVRTRVFLQKMVELLLCAVLFLFPYTTSPFFHLHHWYAGWLVGMHFNFDVWWSRAAMAWCWGCYINGIAVYGRDPILTCGYAYHVSSSQSCPYLKCYEEGIHRPANDTANHTNHPHVEPMLPPDWRNCSSSTYHG